MNDKKLAESIFLIKHSVEGESSLNKYVQIKKQSVSFGLDDHHILQIIDISDQIMYRIASKEKNLLSIINATVSHEMRNPLNSIYS